MERRAGTARGEVVLRHRGDGVLELRVNGVFVMDTTEASSEQALAALTLAATATPWRVLVAGLGLGRTLAVVLADDRVQQADVVELEPALVEWLHDDVVPGGAELLADPRVNVRIGDVAELLGGSGPFDALLLDVDNGPDYLVHKRNADLYRAAFVRRCAAELARGGVLGIWSMNESADLERALGEVFAQVRAIPCPVRHGGRDETYWVYLALTSQP